MACKSHQKRRVQGRSEPMFTGLAAEVYRVLVGLQNIDGVSCGQVRSYRGEPKVKMSWGGNQPFLVIVCDAGFGEREMRVTAIKAGAIARILRKNLQNRGIRVC